MNFCHQFATYIKQDQLKLKFNNFDHLKFKYEKFISFSFFVDDRWQ